MVRSRSGPIGEGEWGSHRRCRSHCIVQQLTPKKQTLDLPHSRFLRFEDKPLINLPTRSSLHPGTERRLAYRRDKARISCRSRKTRISKAWKGSVVEILRYVSIALSQSLTPDALVFFSVRPVTCTSLPRRHYLVCLTLRTICSRTRSNVRTGRVDLVVR
jgi:hypothetical protein